MAEHSKPIALIGSMAAGKSTLAKALAAHWHCAYFDLDEQIEQLAAMSIPKLVALGGERLLRSYEHMALQQLIERTKHTPHVLATGGGTWLDPICRSWLSQYYQVIWLDCPWPILQARLAVERDQRPLLAALPADNWQIKAYQRHLERLPSYQACPLHWSLDGQTAPDKLAEQLGASWHNLGQSAVLRRSQHGLSSQGASLLIQSRYGSYPVQFVADMADVVRLLQQWQPGGKLILFADPTVMALHGSKLASALEQLDRQIHCYTLPQGEPAKQLAVVEQIYGWLAKHDVGLGDSLLALGGGIVSDVVGFVGATWLRGVTTWYLPTTTLAVVDASVGGKNGVNLAHAKNQVGTIVPPKGIIVALGWLRSQPAQVHRAGLVEAVKMALTLDKDLFEQICTHSTALLALDEMHTPRILLAAIATKAKIISQDELEQGVRAVLNFGHTVGHALEAAASFRLNHGLAVALGMMAEMELAIGLGWTAATAIHAYQQLMATFGIGVDWREQQVAVEALAYDKKRRGNWLELPICPEIGQYAFRQVPLATIALFVQDQGALS